MCVASNSEDSAILNEGVLNKNVGQQQFLSYGDVWNGSELQTIKNIEVLQSIHLRSTPDFLITSLFTRSGIIAEYLYIVQHRMWKLNWGNRNIFIMDF